jgi:hypothetical protein
LPSPFLSVHLKSKVILVDWQKDGKWDGGLIDRNRDGTDRGA